MFRALNASSAFTKFNRYRVNNDICTISFPYKTRMKNARFILSLPPQNATKTPRRLFFWGDVVVFMLMHMGAWVCVIVNLDDAFVLIMGITRCCGEFAVP